MYVKMAELTSLMPIDYIEEGVLRMTSAIEKPERPKTNHAIMPVYIFSGDIFNALSETGRGVDGELQLTDAIQKLITARKRVIGVNLMSDELRLDLGTLESMVEALKVSLSYVDAKRKALIPKLAEETPAIQAVARRT